MAGTVQDFENLVVYQKAREMAKQVYSLTRNREFSKDFSLVDQIRRSSVSVVSNIAEGFERGGNREFVQFLSIAKGSCGEVRAQLTVAADQGYITKAEHDRLNDGTRHLGIMLSHLIDGVRKADHKGRRYAPVSCDGQKSASDGMGPDGKPKRPARAGQTWGKEESQQLAKLFDEGWSVDRLAVAHERTPVAIAARLVQIGKIAERDQVL